MIKRTLYFGNPSYLSLTHAQLVLRLPEVEKNETVPEHFIDSSEADPPVPVMLTHPKKN
jgi:CRISPR-associated protein Cas1